MNKLLATLALGTTLAFGLVTVNALAKDGSEHSGKSESSSGKSESSTSNSGSSTSTSGSSHDQGETDEANETEDHGTVSTTPGTGEQEAENETETGDDDAPPVLPALTPLGTNVLLPLLSKKHHDGELTTIY